MDILRPFQFITRSFLRQSVSIPISQFLCSENRTNCSVKKQLNKLNVDIPDSLIPSYNLINSLNRHAESAHLAKLLAELEVFRDIGERLPSKLTDEQWKIYFLIGNAEDRKHFISNLYYQELTVAESSTCINRRAERDHDHIIGRMSYSPEHHCLHHLTGSSLRKCIDSMYGSRILAAKRCDDGPPHLFIDMRFFHELPLRHQTSYLRLIQTIHRENWSSRFPYEITIANFCANDHDAAVIKAHWKFLFGPNGDMEHDIVDVQDTLDSEHAHEKVRPFVPHPFIPKISNRSVRDNLNGLSPDEIAYVSWDAMKTLEMPLKQYKGFVVCASHEKRLRSSSLYCARLEGIKPFRPPFHRHDRWSVKRKGAIDITTSVLRRVYNEDVDWDTALSSLPDKFFETNLIRKNNHEERVKRRLCIEALQEADSLYDRRIIELNRREIRNINFNRTNEKKLHRISREERNLARRASSDISI